MAMLMVSLRGILVKRLSTSKEIRNLLVLKERLWNSLTKENESLTIKLSGIRGLRMEHKYLANL